MKKCFHSTLEHFVNYSRSCHQVAIPLYTFTFITLTLLSLAASRVCVTLEPSCMTLLTNESPIAQLVRVSNWYLEGHGFDPLWEESEKFFLSNST